MLDWLRRLGLRDRKSAPAGYIAWHALGRPTWSSRDVLGFAREGYGRNAIAYRCVRLIAEAAASVRLRVTPEDHPLAALFAAPNPEQSGAELLEAFFGHLQVAGNSFLEAVSFTEEAPRALYVLRPDRMSVIPGARGWPIGWEHRAGAQVTRYERDPLNDRSPILHLKLFSPADDWAAADVPLAETAEAYRVEIMAGVSVIRSIDTATPSVIYTAAQQTADFGASPSALSVRVAQLSSTYGAGMRVESTIWL